jgi:hypothetical protein
VSGPEEPEAEQAPDGPEGAEAQALPESATVPAGWLPDGAEALFGEGARAEEAYGLLTVDVPPGSWISALETARDGLGCRFFDWLSAVDEPGTGFQVCAHVVALPGDSGTEDPREAGPKANAARTERTAEAGAEARTGAPEAGVDEQRDERPTGGAVRRLLLRTAVPHEAPVLPTATAVFAGAAWHERETHEMFGVDFTGHPGLTPLLLPDSFEGHPLRKDFVLAARVAKAWPGAVEPGESSHGAPKRRQMLPPGVPDPNEWGPLKGQLPPVPSRPARGRAGRAGTAERPARRTRSASAGSASQREDAQPGEQRSERGQERGQAPERPPEPPTERPTEQERPSPGEPRGRGPSDAPWHDDGQAPGNTGPGDTDPGNTDHGNTGPGNADSRNTGSADADSGGDADPGTADSRRDGAGAERPDPRDRGSDPGDNGSGPRPPKGGA